MGSLVKVSEPRTKRNSKGGLAYHLSRLNFLYYSITLICVESNMNTKIILVNELAIGRRTLIQIASEDLSYEDTVREDLQKPWNRKVEGV